MYVKKIEVSMFDLIVCLSETIDLVDPILTSHHRQVAYIAFKLAEASDDFSLEERNDMLTAGALHDIGALSLNEKIAALDFEVEQNKMTKHALLGYLLLKKFYPLKKVSSIIKYHHTRWNNGSGMEVNGEKVPLGSHLIHLADRIAVLVDKSKPVLEQVDGIVRKIKRCSGVMFNPRFVDLFCDISIKEHFWFDLVSPILDFTLSKSAKLPTFILTENEVINLSRIFSHIIDFRSNFTSTHSSGVAATATSIAAMIGFSDQEIKFMQIAGYLHDLGKLAVPPEILNKPGKLSPREFNLIRSHTFHTYRSLERIHDFETINAWASFHHERLTGQGYPFRIDERSLPLGSRIMSVADIFTALTENRPYRKGMDPKEAMILMRRMAREKTIDPAIFSYLEKDFSDINAARQLAQEKARRTYRLFRLQGEQSEYK